MTTQSHLRRATDSWRGATARSRWGTLDSMRRRPIRWLACSCAVLVMGAGGLAAWPANAETPAPESATPAADATSEEPSAALGLPAATESRTESSDPSGSSVTEDGTPTASTSTDGAAPSSEPPTETNTASETAAFEQPLTSASRSSGEAPVLSGVTAESLSVTPAAGGSAPLTIHVDVGDASTLSHLDSVVLCMYNLASGDPSCDRPDTSYTMRLTWTQATNTFRLLPDTDTTWSELGSTSSYDPANTSMTMRFRFRVGAVAHAGKWGIRVRATDRGGESTTAEQRVIVNYSASISGRAAQSFSGLGSIGSGGTAYALDAADGTVIANAPSTVTIRISGPFVSNDTSATARLAPGRPTDAVPPRFVAMDCNAGPTFIIARAIRLTEVAQELQADIGPTGEAGISDNVNSCRLISGGGLPTGTYEAEVTTGIRQS